MEKPVVVVTGGGRGIGRAVCQRFAESGAQVVAAARTLAELDETRRLIEGAGGKCFPHTADVCQEADIASLVEKTVSEFGQLDILVNCAGIAPLALIEDLDASLFETTTAVNMDAIYRTSRAVWPVMKKQGGGTIVSISSAASADPFPGFTAYGASKAWVNAWTRGLADEGRPHGIQVFAVAPGAVETKMLRDVFPDFPKEQALAPREVANAVYVVCQPDCRTMTGQTVFLKKG